MKAPNIGTARDKIHIRTSLCAVGRIVFYLPYTNKIRLNLQDKSTQYLISSLRYALCILLLFQYNFFFSTTDLLHCKILYSFFIFHILLQYKLRPASLI